MMRTFFSKFFLITFCASMVLVLATSCSKEDEMTVGPVEPNYSKHRIVIPDTNDNNPK